VSKSGFVALIGRPNCGKSTLLNQLLGEKVSIVSDKPQTTRDRILGILTRPEGQVVFIDTPGIHKPGYELNKRMMQAVLDSFDGTDLVLFLVDANTSFGSGDRFALNLIKERSPQTLLLLNKIDLIPKEKLLPLIFMYSQEYEFLEIVPCSALKRDNLDLLEGLIFKHLPEGPAYFPEDEITDRPERFLAAELVREKILEHTREELPYSTTVLVASFKERGDLTLIHCDIYVEKESQKKIVVGREGQSLKKIGIESRKEIEKLIGKRVYLELYVKVKVKWRDDLRFLDSLRTGAMGSSSTGN
jgi:GTP-binding protein Era